MNSKVFKMFFCLILVLLLLGYVTASNTDDDTTLINDSTLTKNSGMGDNSINENELTTPIGTEILVDPIEDTHFSDNFTITGNHRGKDGKALKNSKLNVDIDGLNYNTKTNSNGTFTLKLKTMNVGINNVTISFNASSGYDSSVTTTTFNVIPQTTEITLDTLPITQYSDILTVKGHYADKNGVNLRYTNIQIKINNVNYYSKTDNEGVFAFDYQTRTVGVNNITVSYPGNQKYSGDSFSSTFNVIPKATSISINDIKPAQYTDTIIVTGSYKDVDGRVLRYTPMTLKVNNMQYVNSTTNDGNFIFNVKTTKVGTNTLIVSYAGNTRYEGTSTSKNFNVTRKDTFLTIDAINDTQYTDYVIITGRYADTSGNNLRYTPLKLNINNVSYTVTTDGEGIFTFKTKASTIGKNTVTVSYPGNARYNMATKTASFNVNKKSTKISLNTSISGNRLIVKGRFTDTNMNSLRYTPVILEFEHSNVYINNAKLLKTSATTDANGYFNSSYNYDSYGTYTVQASYYGNGRYDANTTKSSSIVKGDSHIYVDSLQATVNEKKTLRVNVTDELNNSISQGQLSLHIDNKLVGSINASTKGNIFTIPAMSVGIYDLKVSFTSAYYKNTNKTVRLTVNPASDYTIKLIWTPAIKTNQLTKISALIRNNSKQTVNKGTVRFYLNGKYLGEDTLKNNLTKVRFNATLSPGYYPAKIEYYLNNKFVGADSDILYVRPVEAQKAQNTFITMASDLVSNSLITSSKKDVYFAMDRTTAASQDYSPNDMKIMNGIAYNLRMNGFNVKTIRNGPGETYKTAKYMYDKKIKNSICFILCNGVDANVIREYLKGNDGYLTAVRNRGNDIVMGWFYGAGNFYDPGAEYYYYLEKAWDDNYSGKGGIAYPRRTMEKDGIKIVYEHDDFTGADVANSFIKLYGGKVTTSVSKGSTISLKTSLYNTSGTKITSGNIVYTLNGKIIRNVTVNSNSYTFKYTLPTIGGTYNLKATYYSANKLVCQTWDRYIKVI